MICTLKVLYLIIFDQNQIIFPINIDKNQSLIYESYFYNYDLQLARANRQWLNIIFNKESVIKITIIYFSNIFKAY